MSVLGAGSEMGEARVDGLGGAGGACLIRGWAGREVVV